MDSKGQEVNKLDTNLAKEILSKKFNEGYRSLAVAFIHSYLNTSHEKKIAKIAKQIGFSQISTSAGVSKLIKLVSRGDTAVVDAYLSPILRRYVKKISSEVNPDELKQKKLFFMQSSGGLVNADSFQGKDAILSGPAGGVVGMVKTAEQAGITKLIGFDMGGTSTDVCHFSGNY